MPIELKKTSTAYRLYSFPVAILDAAAVVLLVGRRGVVLTLLASAATGTILVTVGLALPH